MVRVFIEVGGEGRAEPDSYEAVDFVVRVFIWFGGEGRAEPDPYIS